MICEIIRHGIAGNTFGVPCRKYPLVESFSASKPHRARNTVGLFTAGPNGQGYLENPLSSPLSGGFFSPVELGECRTTSYPKRSNGGVIL